MKNHKIALAVFLWISAFIGTAIPQSDMLPTVPVESRPSTQPLRAPQPIATPTPSPTPGPVYIDILNDKVKLDKGDRLSYRIAEERSPALTLTINDSGDVDIPLIGHMHVVGKTCKSLADEIKPLLEKDYYYSATVIIGLETHSERPVGKFYVMGQIRLPGAFEIPAGEVMSVSKALARAQGFSDFADKESVRLIRRNEQGKSEMFIINVGEIVDKGLLDKDPPIAPNDTIIVPEIKRFHSKVYVLGKVHLPHGFEMEENEQLTVTKAIARAQGFAEFADREKVKLFRKSVIIPWFAVDDFPNPFGLANKILSGADPVSQHLRTLFAPESLAKLTDPAITQQQQKFLLIEELNKAIQGPLLYEEKRFQEINLSTDSKRTKALNPKNADLIRLNRMLLEDVYTQELRKNRPPEYQVFIINIAEILDRGQVDKDPPMEPNDLVIVPENKRTNSRVSVMGKVHFPQTVEMLGSGNLTVSQVIARAGGFSEFANKRKIKLLRKTPTETYYFNTQDIVKLRPLLKRLREGNDNLSRYLWAHFNYQARQTLTDPRATPAQQQVALVKEFNRFLKAGLLYTDDRFVEYKLPIEITTAVTAQSGTCLLTPDDFLDLSGFIQKILLHNDPFFLFLWNQFTEPERKILQNAVLSSRQQESTLMQALLGRLNTILKGGCIYSPVIFEKIEISPETLSLLTQNPQGEELVRLNRLLLEDNCPQELKKTSYNPYDNSVIRLNRRLFEVAYVKEIKRHEEYQTIMVDMERIIDKAELDKDPLTEPDDLVVVPERWINF